MSNGDKEFIDYDQFEIYYINDKGAKVPIYINRERNYFEGNLLASTPKIFYHNNQYQLRINWNADSNLPDYNTYLAVSYKVLKGRTLSIPNYGDNSMVDVPIAHSIKSPGNLAYVYMAL